MANTTLIVIMIWFCFGVMWATLHDTMNTTLPETFPVALAESTSTWNVMQWIWNFLPLMMGLNIGIASYKNEGSYAMQKIGSTLKNSIILFIVVTMIMILWLSTYNFTFHTLPDSMAMLHMTAGPSYLLTVYNSALLCVIIGLILIMFAAAL
jgi:hypothetical protein